MGVAMGSKGGPVLAWCVCMINEYRFHSTLGVDSRHLRVYRYFDDVWQLMIVPRLEQSEDWVSNKVAALQSSCYPTSLRLIQNSQGHTAEMLSCRTEIVGNSLTCVHRSKNARYLQQGLKPRFANFVPFASAHAKRRTVMRNICLGLLHRMYMDTKPSDVHLLLPVLQCYQTELQLAGYPVYFFSSVVTLFSRHSKVANSQAWQDLFVAFKNSEYV